MIYLLCFCLFVIGFFIGFIVFGIMAIHYYEDKFFLELTRFEDRIDFSFEKYFGYSLFPDKDK